MWCSDPAEERARIERNQLANAMIAYAKTDVHPSDAAAQQRARTRRRLASSASTAADGGASVSRGEFEVLVADQPVVVPDDLVRRWADAALQYHRETSTNST